MTRILSDIKKEEGDIKSATDILCELQVETFGSMSRREKTEFILEQVALCIQKGDWTQAGILSRKISTRYFARKPKKTPEQIEQEKKEKEERERKKGPDEAPAEPEDDVTDLKLHYFEQQITLAKHDKKYLDVCKHWRQVLDTEAVENNQEQLSAVSVMTCKTANRVADDCRHCNTSSTLLFWRRTTTSNPTFSTAFFAIHATNRFRRMPRSSSCSRWMS